MTRSTCSSRSSRARTSRKNRMAPSGARCPARRADNHKPPTRRRGAALLGLGKNTTFERRARRARGEIPKHFYSAASAASRLRSGWFSPSFGEARRSASGAKAAALKRDLFSGSLRVLLGLQLRRRRHVLQLQHVLW